jgi:hypothetical protein
MHTVIADQAKKIETKTYQFEGVGNARPALTTAQYSTRRPSQAMGDSVTAGQQLAHYDEADGVNVEYENARDRFGHAAAIGDTFFFFDYWSAWSVLPERKRIAPVTRIYIGDERGNVVFERPVVFNALTTLILNFSTALQYEVEKLAQMPGYKFHTLRLPDELFAELRKAEEVLRAAREQMETGGLLVQVGDNLNDTDQT